MIVVAQHNLLKLNKFRKAHIELKILIFTQIPKNKINFNFNTYLMRNCYKISKFNKV